MIVYIKIVIPEETVLPEPTMTAEEVGVEVEAAAAVTTTDTADMLRSRAPLGYIRMSFLH